MATNFTESAQGLARNPLGIIALFISFVYALACIVIGVSTKTLNFFERIPLIYFVIIFPILTLSCFMWLVIKHPIKLYAPSDYKEDKSFMDTMGISNTLKQLMPAPVSDELGDPIANLLYSSITGVFALYAVHLSREYNKGFTLDTLHLHCNILVPAYTHGFLVAATSVGAINLSSGTNSFSVVDINETINSQIKRRAYEVIEYAEHDKDGLYAQLRGLEVAFGTSNISNQDNEDEDA